MRSRIPFSYRIDHLALRLAICYIVYFSAHAHATQGVDAATSFGTGFFITEKGHIVTNYHVIDGADEIRIKIGSGEPVGAKTVITLAPYDLAILKISPSKATPYLTLGDSYRAQLGESVFTVGFPQPESQGFSPKLASGEVSGLSGYQDDINHFQISNPIQPGNSGGALVRDNGEVIGVIVSKLVGGENVAYAIKSSKLAALIEITEGLGETVRSQKVRSFVDRLTSISKANAATVQIFAYNDGETSEPEAKLQPIPAKNPIFKGIRVNYNILLTNTKTKKEHKGIGSLWWNDEEATGGYKLTGSDRLYHLAGDMKTEDSMRIHEVTDGVITASGTLSVRLYQNIEVLSGIIHNINDKRSFTLRLTANGM